MMEFRVLGSLEVRSGGTTIELGGPRQRAVLSALLLRANDVASIGYLAEAAWETPPSAPESNVRTYIAGLRRRLSAEGETGTRLRTCATGYQLVVGQGELDLMVFEDLTERGARSLGAENFRAAITPLEQAVRLWRGQPLEGQQMGPRLRAELARLEERRLRAIEQYIQAKIGLGQHDDVIAELSQLVAEYPLREEFRAQLMLSLYRSGRQAEALECFGQARTRLVEELGIEPGPTLQLLCQKILTSDATLAVETRSQAARYCCLPRDVEGFTGRDAETRRLLAALDETRPAVVVSTIDGMAGAGKTALAVHAAHLLAARFPDGAFFVDLHAHTAGHDPVDPAKALYDLLRARGVPGERIPDTLEARAALWRSELAGRKILIVLDDAISAAQIRPLLPGTTGSVALITSRHRLADLEATHTMSLDVLPSEDAIALFARVVGDDRAVRGAPFVDEAVRLCGYLPLAIRIAAARLRTRRAWTVDHLVARLREQTGELNELTIGDSSVNSAFTLSYRYLSTDQQRMFRLLGLIPGPDFDSHGATALTGGTLRETDRLVEQLLDVHLLQQPTAGRYRFHDLVRTYAAQLATTSDDERRRRVALTRLSDYYLHAASMAVKNVAPQDIPASTGMAVGPAPCLPDYDQALAWLEAERPNLMAAAIHAARNGRPAHTGRFSMLLQHFLLMRGYRQDALTLHTHALNAMRGIGNRSLEGYALNSLGSVYWWLGHYEKALIHIQQALTLARNTGNRSLEGRALENLGLVHRRIGHYEKALTLVGQALTLARHGGDRGLEGRALENLGSIYQRTGRHEKALIHIQQALTLARNTGDRNLEGHTLNSLGTVYRRIGNCERALTHTRQALAIARQAGYRHLEAEVLNRLAEANHANGNPAEALVCHRQALTLAREIGSRYEQARAQDGFAYACHDLNRLRDAHNHWQKAVDMYTELRVPEAIEARYNLEAVDRQLSRA